MRMAAFTKKKKQQQQKLAKMRTGFANSSAPGSNSNRDLNGLGTTGQPMSSTGRASSSAVSQSSSTSKTEAVTFPEKLKILLENDNRLVEGGLKMPKLPARVSVSRIFDEIFFDLLIESDLLYPIEKTRYLSLTKSPANVIRSIDITGIFQPVPIPEKFCLLLRNHLLAIWEETAKNSLIQKTITSRFLESRNGLGRCAKKALQYLFALDIFLVMSCKF
ncbi:unnamed protein product [Gongylonema pulchrum]|uniref:MRG domain-containing protein n=1 Tax=Gongylonema pulchrum TaxID=637853 RepID=A0A183E499_9BILA|nr:unnamed protein product [Gongylonema pulchrum]